MKLTPLLQPASMLASRLFFPLHPAIQCMHTAGFPDLLDFNAQLEERPICVKLGHPLRFVPQETGKLGFESQYEPRCYLTGEVQTRPNNWHDFFNALVWLTFPKSKAAINRRHYLALNAAVDNAGSQRGKARDMATLFDESGVIVVCANPGLAEKLTAFQWKELFWQQRSQAESAMGFFIFGHGLYEKSLQPYVGMTGQGLLFNVSADFFTKSLEAQLSLLDTFVADYLDNPEHCSSTRELHPVPLLGIPGWSEENNAAEYYDNTNYFRPGRRE